MLYYTQRQIFIQQKICSLAFYCFLVVGSLFFLNTSFLTVFPVGFGDGVAPEVTSVRSSLTCNPQQMGVYSKFTYALTTWRVYGPHSYFKEGPNCTGFKAWVFIVVVFLSHPINSFVQVSFNITMRITHKIVKCKL